MPEEPNPKAKVAIAELFSSLTQAEQEEAREALDAYCELLFQIFQRWTCEDHRDFDESGVSS